MRAPSIGATRFERMTSSSTARSERGEHQPVHRVVGQGEPAEAVHRVGDVDQQRVRHRVARVAHQRVDDLLGVVPGGAGVPQRERRDPVGVHVLGGALQLGERGDRRPAVLRQRVVDLEQQGLVRLDDQGAVTHQALVPLPGSGSDPRRARRAPGGSGTLHRNRPARRLPSRRTSDPVGAAQRRRRRRPASAAAPGSRPACPPRRRARWRAMYSRHTRARPSLVAATASSQCSSRLRTQARSVSA